MLPALGTGGGSSTGEKQLMSTLNAGNKKQLFEDTRFVNKKAKHCRDVGVPTASQLKLKIASHKSVLNRAVQPQPTHTMNSAGDIYFLSVQDDRSFTRTHTHTHLDQIKKHQSQRPTSRFCLSSQIAEAFLAKPR